MQLTLALALLAATWLVLRRQADAGLRGPICWPMLPLDVAPIALGWLLLQALTHRPIVAATGIAAAGAGLAVADAVKRATLREPLVFADRSELLEVFRHPRLYLPFAGPARIIGGAALALLAITALLWLEPAVPGPPLVLMAGVVAGAVLLPGWPPLLRRIARVYQSARPTGDPEFDMRRFGFLACLIVHATLARAERPSRRAAVRPLPRGIASGGPVVMLQIESFFDVRRLGPGLPREAMPGFARLAGEAVQSGLLNVPCWGANTVRTEFAALTGIDQTTLGLDRFNPYERFAQEELGSIAARMKQAGYRTICLHPFDQGFYARDRVMPRLGFDAFYGPGFFEGAPMAGPYVADEAMGEAILDILRTHGPRVFVLAITMGNHGPWDESATPPHAPARGWPAAWDGLADTAPLRRYLAGVQASDRMLETLAADFPSNGLLAVYGDHQPSLPGVFKALGFTDERTDYALWRPGRPKPGRRRDIRAEDLPGLLLQVLADTQELPVRSLPVDAMARNLP